MSTILEGYSPREKSRLKTRFWQFVHKDGRDHGMPPEQCWEWHGGTGPSGTPVYGTKRRVYPARHVAYALEVEDFEEGHYILETCHNQMCVNPHHMRLAVLRDENSASNDAKMAATNAVNAAVWHYGTLPQVSTQVCVICGRPAEHYHHYLGYAPEHWLDVRPVCSWCHKRAEWKAIRESAPVYYVQIDDETNGT